MLNYDDLSRKARAVRIYGTTVLVADLDDIIEAKRALRRAPDLAALPELYRLREREGRTAGLDGV